jgi:hypothetical protein
MRVIPSSAAASSRVIHAACDAHRHAINASVIVTFQHECFAMQTTKGACISQPSAVHCGHVLAFHRQPAPASAAKRSHADCKGGAARSKAAHDGSKRRLKQELAATIRLLPSISTKLLRAPSFADMRAVDVWQRMQRRTSGGQHVFVMISFKIQLLCGFFANFHRRFCVDSASSPISLAAADITFNRLRCVLFDITRATAHRLQGHVCTPSTPASRRPINARIHRCSHPQAPSGHEAHGSNTQTLQHGGNRAVAREDKMTVALLLIARG